jgi:hypothetical protein
MIKGIKTRGQMLIMFNLIRFFRNPNQGIFSLYKMKIEMSS